MTQIRRLALAAFALLLVVAPARAALAAITCPSAASIPSVTSGHAPLAVFFDATATMDSNTTIPFQDDLFSWSFGDPSAGTWAFSGQSKNKAAGGVAAHVFETVGTYTPILDVMNSSGQTCRVTLPTITVSDPAASLTTWCFSTTADFTGCPGSATRVTQSNFNTIMSSYVATNRRLLLHRGQTFTATAAAATAVGPWMLASFGSGAKPIISTTYGRLLNISDRSNVVLQDLNIRGTIVEGQGNNFCGTYNLLLRVDVDGFQDNNVCDTNVSGTFPGYHHYTWVDGVWGNYGGYNAFLGGAQVALMGMDFGLFVGPHTDGWHNVRMTVLQKGVIQHNMFRPQNHAEFETQLKWQSGTFRSGGAQPNDNEPSEFSILSFNTFYGGTNGGTLWPVVLGPQNSWSDERHNNEVIENNYFTASAGGLGNSATRNLFRFSGTYSTIRNNIADGGIASGDGTLCFLIETYGVELASGNNKAYNNTCVYRGSNTDFRMFESSSTGGSIFRNNLFYVTASSPSFGGSDTIDHNVTVTGATPFVNTNYAVPTDYEIQAPNSSIIGAGASVPVLTDFGLRQRTGSWDLGAWARSGSLGQPGRPTLVP